MLKVKTPLERTIQLWVVKYLNSRPKCWHFKVHGGRFQVKGLPDIIGLDNGRFFAMELKRPGRPLTKLQQHFINKIKKAGGLAGRVTSVEEAEELLRF